MMIIGIDIGSLATKLALIGDNKELVDVRVDRSTYDFKRIGHNLFDDILEKNNLKRYALHTFIFQFWIYPGQVLWAAFFCSSGGI